MNARHFGRGLFVEEMVVELGGVRLDNAIQKRPVRIVYAMHDRSVPRKRGKDGAYRSNTSHLARDTHIRFRHRHRLDAHLSCAGRRCHAVLLIADGLDPHSAPCRRGSDASSDRPSP